MLEALASRMVLANGYMWLGPKAKAQDKEDY